MKKMFLKIGDEFVYGGHLISLGVMSIVILAATVLDIHPGLDFYFVVYLLALAPCLFGRYVDLHDDSLTNPERSIYLGKKGENIPFYIVLVILLMIAILMYRHKYAVLLYIGALISLSFLYDYYIKKFTQRIMGLKNFFVSMLFCSVVMILIIYSHAQFSDGLWFILAFVFVRVFIGTSFSDIKDIQIDRKNKLRTFVVVLGLKNLMKLLFWLNIFADLIIVVGVLRSDLPVYALMLLFASLYSFFYMVKISDNSLKKGFIFNVLVDGELVLWLFFLLAGKVLEKWFI